MENNQIENIRYFATGRSITLFWDQAENFVPGLFYRISVNGECVGTSQKTHYTLTDLKPAEQYDVSVKAFCGVDMLAEGHYGIIHTQQTKRVIDITQPPYCAMGDGKKLNTAEIQRAIDACGSDDVLFIPKGVFMTGSLRLHSNMEIFLDDEAVLQGTDQVKDYLPKIPSRFEGTELLCYSSLLNMGALDRVGGYNCQNVFIHGKGTIASGGNVLAWNVINVERENMKAYLEELGDAIKECEDEATIPGRVRPRLINMSNCQNVVLSGLTLKNGASWNVHMIYSDNIVTHDCTFYSENVRNGDGWDPDSSTNCTIFGCEFFTGDDSVAIKSGKNPEGNIINRPSAHIRIFDCVSRYGHGVTIGSEMSGGIEDVKIWDCDLKNSVYGIEIKGTKKRGGYVRDIQVSDCVLPRVLFHSVGYNDDGISAGTAPIFEKCTFQRVQISGAYLNKSKEWCNCTAIELCGFDETDREIRDIEFRDIQLGMKGMLQEQTLSLCLCKNVAFRNLNCI